MAGLIRVPRRRTIREFAVQELIIPSGPMEGRRLDLAVNPVVGLLLDALGDPALRRSAVAGPVQAGKTLFASVTPVLYHLFEVGETVVYGVPSLDMRDDKWTEDLLPAISASRYRELLPRSGGGSRGGVGKSITFRNGATLRFMSGGGGDKVRAGFTARVAVITEVDGMDEAGGRSRETDKVSQIEARTNAFAQGSLARVYLECTVSIEKGRIWREITGGTNSRIACKCPKCSAYVTPGREHLVGWQGAEDVIAAAELARVCCPACGELWTEADRLAANTAAILLHGKQEVGADGSVSGEMPRTNTLGFRWTATNNMLVPIGTVAQDEWKAARAADPETAETGLLQFRWTTPVKPDATDLSVLDVSGIAKRTAPYGLGICPEDTELVTVGIDVGKRLCHWTGIAWRPGATPHIPEYGRLEVPVQDFDEEAALLIALRTFRDRLEEGWLDKNGRRLLPKLVFVDAGYLQDVVLKFVAESGPPFYATKGFGVGQRKEGNYKREGGSKVLWHKDGYALVRLPDGREYIEVRVDQWKTHLHARLQAKVGGPGALTFYENGDHFTIGKHFTAEKREEVYEVGKGIVTRWVMLSRNNHYLDSTTLATVAGHEAGVRLAEVAPPPPPPPPKPKKPKGDRGSSWVPEVSNWV